MLRSLVGSEMCIRDRSSILSVGLIDANKPATFVDLNNGQYTHLYNYNIIEESVESESGTSEIQYRYDSVRVEYPLTANHILETLLGALYPLSVESKLRNDYEAAVLGIEPESKKEGYIAVSYTHLRAHETPEHLVCRLLLEKKKKNL
eukprot:TRINITY_DN16127_c0_g1_i1.p1 TRINITY_DN16127_c0_g1~~TRINITY_DN16127_c0_g1_i1.p1  ORF type:complete len:148 (-),score=10.01 TRINITY_DN16127_c0_g1_i1:7-450(-)